jgi:hypothetical protein
MRTYFLAVAPALFAVLACGSVATSSSAGDAGKDAGPTGADSGKACSDDTECDPDQICGYLQSAGCEAHGQCVARANDGAVTPGGCILAYSCGCDGGTIDHNVFCAPGVSGYVSAPIRHTGPCGSDGG